MNTLIGLVTIAVLIILGALLGATALVLIVMFTLALAAAQTLVTREHRYLEEVGTPHPTRVATAGLVMFVAARRLRLAESEALAALDGGRELFVEFCPNRRSSSSHRASNAATCSRSDAFSALRPPDSSDLATLHNFAPAHKTPAQNAPPPECVPFGLTSSRPLVRLRRPCAT